VAAALDLLDSLDQPGRLSVVSSARSRQQASRTSGPGDAYAEEAERAGRNYTRSQLLRPRLRDHRDVRSAERGLYAAAEAADVLLAQEAPAPHRDMGRIRRL
jgi:hypothetical protein